VDVLISKRLRVLLYRCGHFSFARAAEEFFQNVAARKILRSSAANVER
jgi:hypothetical protein